MSDKQNQSKPMKEQMIYANILQIGAWTGIFLLITTYALYVFGVLPPHVELATVPQYWGQGVHAFVEGAGAPTGWTWLGLLGTGDYLNFIGLALLALLTIVCYLVLIPGFIRRKDWVYAIICIAEVVVLSVAASGVLGSGGH